MFKPNPNEVSLDENIAKLHTELKEADPETEQYATSLDHLTKLYAIKNENRSRRVSPDTMASVGANLLGIGIIVGHERVHIVTSKALGFIKKLV